MDEYDEKLRDILATVIGLHDTRYGFSAAELATAEKLLGNQLPYSLRSMYMQVGRHVLWQDGHHPLVAPSDLSIQDGKIVFLQESQNVVEYVLYVRDLSQEDPPVFQQLPDQPGEIYEESSSLALFLLQSMCWQLVCIGEDLEQNTKSMEMRFGDDLSHDRAVAEVAGMKPIQLAGAKGNLTLGAYYGHQTVAVHFFGKDATNVYMWKTLSDVDK